MLSRFIALSFELGGVRVVVIG
ncbi:hypothetical protein KVMX100_121330 [Klebsiella variicola]|nr:hypothetical protein KVMX100_121330 [Klebsiella variicola]